MFDYFQQLYLQHMFGYEYIITNSILSLFIMLTMNMLPFKGTKNILLKVLDWLVTWAVNIILSDLYYYFFGLDYMQFVVWSVVTFAHIPLFMNKPIADRITKAVTILTMIFSALVLSGEIGEIITFDNNWVIGSTTALILLSMLLCSFWMSFFSTEEYKVTNHKILIIVGLNFIISTTISIVSKTQEMDQWYEILTNFFFMLNAIAIYYAYFSITKEQSEKADYIAVNIKRANDNYLLKRSVENLEDLQKIRHDLRNQYQYMKTLLDEKKYDELNTFFSDMSETSFVPLHYVDCGNTPISISMNQCVNRANSHNIAVNHSIIVPKKLDISDLDITRLITNIMDNAIDAIISEKTENAVIDVKIMFKEPYLILSISNPISEEAAKKLNLSKLKTTKQNKAIHGYGTKIIADIVNKNEGSVSYSVKDGRFTVDAMIKAKEIKE